MLTQELLGLEVTIMCFLGTEWKLKILSSPGNSHSANNANRSQPNGGGGGGLT